MNTRVPLDSAQPEFWAIINTLGHAALVETLKAAAFYVGHSSQVYHSRSFSLEIREAKSCYFYVQGTGLNMLISRYGLEYDPDAIRNSFNYCVRKS